MTQFKHLLFLCIECVSCCRYGRKTALLGFTALYLVSATSSAVSAGPWVFVASRFCVGFAIMGPGTLAAALFMESIAPRLQVMGGLLIELYFEQGGLIITPFAYFIRDFRYLQLALLVPVVCAVIYLFGAAESIPWLYAQLRYSDAKKAARIIAQLNGKRIPANTVFVKQVGKGANDAQNHDAIPKRNGLAAIIHNTIMLKYCFLCNVMNTACLFTFNGISMNLNDLFGEIYVNTAAACALQIPFMFCVYLFSEKIGCKWTYITLLFMASVSSLSICILAVVPGTELTVTIISLFIRNITGCAVGVVVTYIGQIFPANMRGTAIASSFAVASFFSVAAPYVGGNLRNVWSELPFVAFGLICAAGGMSCIFLPDTRNRGDTDESEVI